MATSGSASVAVTSYDTLKISWTVNSQSTSNNTSNITFKAELVATSNGRISSSASKSYTAVINGTTYTGTNTVGVSAGATKTLFSKTLNISHNSDGSCSFTFKFTQEFAITFSGSYISSKTASCTVSPNTIARASSLTSAADTTLGNAVSVKWTPASSSFAYKLKFTVGSHSYTTGYISPNKTSAYTYTGYTMSIADWAPYITTATSATCTVVLYTYSSSSSSSSIGSSSKTFKVTVPSSVIPSVAINSVTEGGDLEGGMFIQNLSKLAVNFTGTSAYSSPLASYTVTAGGLTATGNSLTSGSAKTVTTGTITTSGSITVKVTVTDGRGRSASASVAVSIQEYSAPNISQFEAYRVDELGNVATDGEYIEVKYKYSCSSVSGYNSASMSIKWKQSTDSAYNNTVKTATGLSGSGSVDLDIIFSTDAGFDFQITVTDLFSASTRTVTVTTALYPFSVHKSGNGVAFGKSAETEDLMDVNYAARFLNNLEVHQEKTNIGDYIVNIQNDAENSDTYIRITGFSGKRLHIGIGSGGQNRGLYDPGATGAGNWIVYADEDNNVRLGYGKGTYKPYYSAGDSISNASLRTAGFISTSAGRVYFMVPLSRPVLGSPSISISGTLIVRQNNSYLYGSDADSGVSPSSWTISANAFGLVVVAIMANTTNATNNSPCGVDATLTINFS